MQTQARPPSPQPVIAAKAATRNSSSRRPQKRSFRLPNAAKNPYLNSYANATSATTDSHEKDGPQLRPCPRPTAQIAPNCAKKPSLQLRHATKNSYLNSYANAANATTLSYEKNISSYDCGRIPSWTWPQVRPQTLLIQLRHAAKNPYLNSYANATSKTTPTKKRSPAFRQAPPYPFTLSAPRRPAPLPFRLLLPRPLLESRQLAPSPHSAPLGGCHGLP